MRQQLATMPCWRKTFLDYLLQDETSRQEHQVHGVVAHAVSFSSVIDAWAKSGLRSHENRSCLEANDRIQ